MQQPTPPKDIMYYVCCRSAVTWH